MISTAAIEEALQTYGIADPASDLADKISAYIDLLLKWNRRISLTTVTKPSEIVRFHFGESLFALSQLKFRESRLADVGSGAGFPGLPLAMALPALKVTVIESNLKKCAFLAEVIRQLSISNATVAPRRMEELEASAQFDFVTARALGRLPELLVWSREHLATAGRVLLWLGEDDSREVGRSSGWKWEQPILIPGSKRRYLLPGSPQR